MATVRVITSHIIRWGGAYFAALLGGAIALLTVWGLLPHGLTFAGTPGAIENYVLFQKITVGDLVFTTGTAFYSDSDRRISKQWCYLNGAGTSAAPTLIELGPEGTRTDYPLSPADVTALGIDAAAASKLAATNCHFLT